MRDKKIWEKLSLKLSIHKVKVFVNKLDVPRRRIFRNAQTIKIRVREHKITNAALFIVEADHAEILAREIVRVKRNDLYLVPGSLK